MTEIAEIFSCRGCELVGIVNTGDKDAQRGVLVVVGGPQYRVGSHRQFVLLARELSKEGIPTMRFDYRGMGDSTGDTVTFESIDDDIRAAIDFFVVQCPAVREVVIWGLCDAASAALFYAWQDSRVKGLVLLNPWVRTDISLSHTHLKNYYPRRLVSWSLWKKVLTGRFELGPTFRSVADALAGSVRFQLGARRRGALTSERGASAGDNLPGRMAESWRRFRGPVLLILSGEDLTASEFRNTTNRSREWDGILGSPLVTARLLERANHTFSTRVWRDHVTAWTLQWIRSW